MTYLQFHIVFLFPPLMILCFGLRHLLSTNYQRILWSVGVYAAASLVYVTPWANYFVYKGIWNFGFDRVLASMGYVPLEGYLSLTLQPLLTGLWTLWIFRRQPFQLERRAHGGKASLALFFLGLTVFGLALTFFSQCLYLALILLSSCPILAFQWYVGGDIFLRLERKLLLAFLVPVLYFLCTDTVAISLKIWTLSPEWTLGFQINGLPFEEVVYFLATQLVIVQGCVLLLYDDGLRLIEKRLGPIPKFRPEKVPTTF